LRSRLSEIAIVVALLSPGVARAQGEDDVAKARAEFVRGTDLAKRAQWAEALAAFEQSSKLRPHPVTTYNLGVCYRAMGSYTRAREAFARALAEHDAGGELPETLASENKVLLGEIDRLLATAVVELAPANAVVAVDGRPLAPRRGEEGVLVAGVRDPGPGEQAPSASFKVVLDPGAHIFTFERPGFAEAVVNKTFAPGATIELKLELDRLPATLNVAASEPGAIVTVNGVDVGVAPVEVSRPAGHYRVLVKKDGFKPYDTAFALQPGQKVDLRAALGKEDASITKRWWFWTAAGALVVGVAAGTYALTRGETTRQEPLDGGGLGWTVKLQ
jgi:hypothetical protein